VAKHHTKGEQLSKMSTQPNDTQAMLNEVEVRVLGSLIEKQVTTPEYYPLTLNALTQACNQKNNREPVVSFDEAAVAHALETLRVKNLVYVFYGKSRRATAGRGSSLS